MNFPFWTSLSKNGAILSKSLSNGYFKCSNVFSFYLIGKIGLLSSACLLITYSEDSFGSIMNRTLHSVASSTKEERQSKSSLNLVLDDLKFACFLSLLGVQGFSTGIDIVPAMIKGGIVSGIISSFMSFHKNSYHCSDYEIRANANYILGITKSILFTQDPRIVKAFLEHQDISKILLILLEIGRMYPEHHETSLQIISSLSTVQSTDSSKNPFLGLPLDTLISRILVHPGEPKSSPYVYNIFANLLLGPDAEKVVDQYFMSMTNIKLVNGTKRYMMAFVPFSGLECSPLEEVCKQRLKIVLRESTFLRKKYKMDAFFKEIEAHFVKIPKNSPIYDHELDGIYQRSFYSLGVTVPLVILFGSRFSEIAKLSIVTGTILSSLAMGTIQRNNSYESKAYPILPDSSASVFSYGLPLLLTATTSAPVHIFSSMFASKEWFSGERHIISTIIRHSS